MADEIFALLRERLQLLGESFQVHCCWKAGSQLAVEQRLSENVAKHECAFCHRRKALPGMEKICMEHDRKTLTAALAAHEDYFEARCPAGATELLVPFRRNGLCLGAVLCGPYRKPGDPADADLPELNSQRVASLAAIIRQILSDTIDDAYAGSAARPEDPRIARAVEFMRKNFQRKITAAEVAARVFISRSRLLHLFPQQCGITYAGYLNRLRIEEACRLLRRNELPLDAIAFQLGYRTQSHFTANFKKATGKSPRAWRSSHLG